MGSGNHIGWLLVVPLVAATILLGPEPAAAAPCGLAATASLYGSGDVATLAGTGRTSCHDDLRPVGARQPQPYYTHEIACSTDRQAAAAGLCSTTPCPDFGRFFAFRTLHRPDGTSAAAGFSCVSLERAIAGPGVSVAQVFEAIRRVRLPGGEIGAVPAVRGLANLESYFWVQGATQPPVELSVAGSRVRAEFRAVEYRWNFGEGGSLVTTGPGRPKVGSEVSAIFPRLGRYLVEVTVVWTAEAWLDGRRVGQVDDLVSRAEVSYPVAELRTILTG